MRKNPAAGSANRNAQKIQQLAPYTNPKIIQNNYKTLLLPQKFYNKISQLQYKKIRQAYFLEANDQYLLDRQAYQKVIRSLGIVAKSSVLTKYFDQQNYSKLMKNQKNQIKQKSRPVFKKMEWQQFLENYINLRNHKGSYNQLNNAINSLDKQYSGNWQQFLIDLKQIGDVLDQKQIQYFKKIIMQGKILNNDNILNALLGYQ